MAVLPPFLLLGVGGFARAVGWLRAEADASLSMVTIRILYPCFILFHILGQENFELNLSTFHLVGFGFISILFGFVLSWVVSKIFHIDDEAGQSFRFCSGIFNYGFIAIPVAIAIFQNEIVVHIILFNLGVEIAIWTVGILLLTAKKLSLKGLFNPPAFAVLLALLLHSLGGKELIPIFAWEVVKIIGMCSIPMGLMLIGGNFYQLAGHFKFSNGCRTELGSLLVRNILFPTTIILFVYYGFCPSSNLYLHQVLIVQAAMPAGIFAVVIVGNYGGDRVTAMRTIIVTMVASLLTLPAWLLIGIKVCFSN